jgi:hypothetical protein
MVTTPRADGEVANVGGVAVGEEREDAVTSERNNNTADEGVLSDRRC